MKLLGPTDPRVTLMFSSGGRRVVEVSSGKVVEGQTERAIFRVLLPDFLRTLGKAYPKHADLMERAASFTESWAA